MPLLSDEEILQSSPPRRLLSDDELLGPRPPLYLGDNGRPLTDDELMALHARGPQQSAMSPLGRIADRAGGMYMDALRPDVPLGPSPGTIEKINSVPYVGDFLARQAKVGGTVADFAVRGLAAPFHAAAGAVGQTANELGLSHGLGDTGPARDVLGLLDVAGIMAPAGAGVSLPRGRAAAPRPVAAPAPSATPLQAKLDALAPTPRMAAPDATGAPQTFAPDFAGNINLNRIQAPEDVKNVIREVAATHGNFPNARRGKMTFEDIRELAPMVGMTPDKLASRGIGKTFNAEEMFAARTLLVSQADEVRRLAGVARGGRDADKLAALESINRMVAIQEQVAGATAEAGRLLSQQRMMAGAGRSAESIRRILDTSGDKLDEILDGIAKLDNPEAIAGFVNAASKAKTSDMLLEGWINALLSGPTTHATNILSNTLVAAWQVPEALATATVSKVTGSGVTYRESLSRAFGLVEGAKDGLRAGWRAFLSEEPSDLAAKIEARRYQAIPSKTFRAGKERKEIGGVPVPLTGEIKLGGRQVRLPGRLLTAEDEFFKAINSRAEINAIALRQARAEGKRGQELAARVAELKASPTDEMLTKAREAAEKQTFTNPLGKFGRGLQAMASDVPAVRVVMPFIRTPVNIVKFAAERGPLAPLFRKVRENLKGVNGPQERDGQIARIMLGSTVGAVAASYAADGTITGGGPADPKQRAALYATGWQPYSIKVGDHYYSFGRLEPLGTLLGVSADAVELSKHMTGEEEANVAALIMGSISKNLVSKTWLRGPAELIEAVQDPDRYGDTYVRNLTGTVVPTGIAQIARTRDPYMREARSILDKIKERVPGYRETLPMRRDVFGAPIKLEGALGPDMISPIYTSTDAKDPVANEMVRLGMAPSRLLRQIAGVELDAPEYDTFQKNAGGMTKAVLSKVIASPGYQSLTDEAKREILDDVMRKARDMGRAQTIRAHPGIVTRSQQLKLENARKLVGAR